MQCACSSIWFLIGLFLLTSIIVGWNTEFVAVLTDTAWSENAANIHHMVSTSTNAIDIQLPSILNAISEITHMIDQVEQERLVERVSELLVSFEVNASEIEHDDW